MPLIDRNLIHVYVYVYACNLNFSQRWKSKMWYFVQWNRVVMYVATSVLDKQSASIFRVQMRT